MFPTRILLSVDGSKETPSAVRAAIELAGGTGSEVHLVHVVSTVPELPYPHLAAKERSEAILEWRKLKGLEFLDEQVRRIGDDLGVSVAASYYREGRRASRRRSFVGRTAWSLSWMGGVSGVRSYRDSP